MKILLRELAMFAPSIALFWFVAIHPSYVPSLDRTWLFTVSFLLVELPACVLVAWGANAIGRYNESGLQPSRRDFVLLASAPVLLLLLPAWVKLSTHRTVFAFDVAFAFLPRLILLWRVRNAGDPAIRLAGRCALVGPCLFLTFMAVVPLLGCGNGTEFSAPAALVALYYVLCAVGTACLQLYESRRRRTASWHWL